jgi:DNA invertase Pin-like site-specific DNA recombinase
MLVVTKLDRLARSLPDAREIADELTAREVKLNLGGSVHDPTDPIGRLLFNVLAMVAEFEGDLIRMRTREGMKIARAKGRLRGKQPKLSVRQEAHLVALHRAGHPHQRRACRTVLSRPLDGVPGDPTGRLISGRWTSRRLSVGATFLTAPQIAMGLLFGL